MQYRNDKYGTPLSILGYGCMRFTRKGNGIDIDKAEQELMTAYRAGVNYFDTAYIYPGSEEALGQILERNHIRDQVHIATKLPQFLIRNREAVDKYFDEELTRLRTTYIDYYLMHHVTDVAMWEKLKKVGILDWIRDKKASGAIRNIGFSYHGNTENFLKVLNDYDWDFCQIQYNYLDEHSQAGREGLKRAAEKGIPVIIMEPLRGGKLVNLPSKAMTLLEESGKGWSSAELGLRWLWDQPEVTCVLSGMNSPKMIVENIRIASKAEPGQFTEEDFALVDQVKTIIREREKVSCTGCRYCMPCPKGVDIPTNFYYYNLMYLEEKKGRARFEFARNMGLQKEPAFASQCIGCGKCEQHCPQHISIREKLKEADRELRPLPVKAALTVVRKVTGRG